MTNGSLCDLSKLLCNGATDINPPVDLKDVSTSDLVNELITRDEVTVHDLLLKGARHFSGEGELSHKFKYHYIYIISG